MSNTANDFMTRNSLSFRCEQIEARPDGLMGGEYMTRHFRVEFRTLRNDFALVTFFSQGSAHTKAPTAAEVLSCLATDARSIMDCRDILDFAHEMGYASDDLWHDVAESLRKTFEACQKVTADLTALLGEDEAEELLYLDLEE